MQQPYQPDLDLLKQALGSHVQECHVELIKTTLPWSLVYRVTLLTQGHSSHESVIVKAINPKGLNDPLEAEREPNFYKILYPKINIPKPIIHLVTTDRASGWHMIVMEDLSLTHRIPKHPYQWTRDELRSVLRAYALLHITNISFSESWLKPRHESQLDFDAIPQQVAIVQRAGIWDALPQLSDLISYARESCLKYENATIALLHNDTTPTNAPLPFDLGPQPAVLIDWQDVGIGMPEMDLAYIDLQPFDSGRLIPRSELLSHYWHSRAEIEEHIPSPAERTNRQLHADLVMVLWLTRTASRVALHPHPEGTYPRMHWDSQFGIVYNRLKDLAKEINL
ncbi:MAG: aminoglycoside phosphotransferase family protein [Anaerolineales bacterium]|nr:aminoglycoside phosphotransferase family protein [Anaerolineales bacterium]